MEPLNDSTGFYIKATRQLGEWQTRFQKMAIYETPHYGKLFRLDGFNMTSEKEEFVYHENLIHPALTAHAAPKKVLIIGGGDGGSSEEALKHPSVEQVTMVERGKGESSGCDIMRAIARHAQPLEILRRRLARCAHVPDCRPPKYRPGSSFKTT